MRLKFAFIPARFVLSKRGKHSFGGPPIHQGAFPKGSKLPVHRIATLDAADPLFPLEDYPHLSLPLYYPLAFSFGGGSIQYAVTADNAIRIIHLSDKKSDKNPYVTVDQFPQKNGDLISFTYEEVRAIAMVDGKSGFQLKKSDNALIDRTEAFSSIRIGTGLATCQGEVFDVCRNKKCKWHGMQIKVPVIAIVPCSKDLAGDLWHEYSEYVELCFGICRSCGTIIAVNRCT